MQFKVPQFIDIEDKIFGPFTLRQFGYLLGAGGFAFLFWYLIPIKIFALPLILIFSGTFIALAFVKINNRPFVDFMESAMKYAMANKIYTWKQPTQNTQDNYAEVVADSTKKAVIHRAEQGKLREIAFGLDVLDRGNENNTQ